MVARTRTRKLIWIDKETNEVRGRDRKVGGYGWVVGRYRLPYPVGAAANERTWINK